MTTALATEQQDFLESVRNFCEREKDLSFRETTQKMAELHWWGLMIDEEYGGSAFGPRHLIPALPFLCLGIPFALGRGRALVLGLLLVPSIVNQLAATAVEPSAPMVTDLLRDYLYPHLLRGDVDQDGAIAITDAVIVLNALSRGGPQPGCMRAADVNDDGKLVGVVSTADVLGHLLAGEMAGRPLGAAASLLC